MVRGPLETAVLEQPLPARESDVGISLPGVLGVICVLCHKKLILSVYGSALGQALSVRSLI